MKRLRNWALIFLFFCCSAVSALCEFPLKPYSIGVIAPLSGDVATWGTDVRNALLFAKEKLGAGNLQFIFEDDQCLGKNAVSAAHSLIARGIDAAIVTCSESVLSTAPIFEQRHILLMSSAGSAEQISQAGRYVFRTWPSDEYASKTLYDYIKSRYQRFGIITEARGYAEELTRSVMSHQEGSLQFLNESFLSEDDDVRSLLLRLRMKSAQGLLINANSERQYLNVLRQVKAMKWPVPLYGVYMPGNRAFRELAQGLGDGIVYVDAPSLGSSLTPEGERLFEEYEGRYGPSQSANFVFASTFEALRVIILALQAHSEAAARRAFIASTTFNGIFGPYSFDSHGDIVGVHHSLKTCGPDY